MPQRLAKTKKHRLIKTRKAGAKAKSGREIHGTTPLFPLTGAIPSYSAGRVVKASDIKMPAAKAKVAKAAKAPAAKSAAKSAK